MAFMLGVPKKGLRTLILLIVWRFWKERNQWIFEYKEATSHLLAKTKKEAGMWTLAGAKRIRELISRFI